MFDFEVIAKNFLSAFCVNSLACLPCHYIGTFLGTILGLLKLSKISVPIPSELYHRNYQDTPIMQMFFIFRPSCSWNWLNTFPSAALAMSLFAAGNMAEIVREPSIPYRQASSMQ
jgi:ABC-type amino acid transport system permease subunit